MPAEADARREVLRRVGQGLPVVAEPEVEGEVAAQVDAVLHEPGIEPLRQLVAADPEVDRLRVVLHVGQRQLIEGRGRRVHERERAEDRGAGLAARAAGGVMDHAAAEAEVVLAVRPRQRVRELRLVTEEVGGSRLSDGERHRPGARVGGGEGLRFPERDRVAIQVGESRLVEKIRAEDRTCD